MCMPTSKVSFTSFDYIYNVRNRIIQGLSFISTPTTAALSYRKASIYSGTEDSDEGNAFDIARLFFLFLSFSGMLTQHRLVSLRCFGTACRSHLQCPSCPTLFDFMGVIDVCLFKGRNLCTDLHVHSTCVFSG
jgi:hypothetical protein